MDKGPTERATLTFIDATLKLDGSSLNRFSPAKLLHSKWTAVKPQNREKHFLVTRVKFDENGRVIECELEAAMSRKPYDIDWLELKDNQKWIQGWK